MTCTCGAELAPSLLACPACRRLVHADRLKALSAAAAAAARRGEPIEEIANWRLALALLPAESLQSSQVAAHIAAVEARIATPTMRAMRAMRATRATRAMPAVPGEPTMPATGRAAALPTAPAELGRGGQDGRQRRTWGTGGALATGAAALLSKGKLLLLGLTKVGTLLSMLLSVGVYWTAFGWPFAVGMVLSIYVHEMGHVMALHQLGLPASAPMFIPGVGALIRLRQNPADPRDDARIGLAGPLWGLGAALVAWLAFLLSGSPLWGAIARFGAWVNLFNLLPFWQLDGGRAFHPLSRPQRIAAAAALAILWAASREGLLLLLLLGAVWQSLRRDAPAQGDPPTLVKYVGLASVLTLLTRILVLTPAAR